MVGVDLYPVVVTTIPLSLAAVISIDARLGRPEDVADVIAFLATTGEGRIRIRVRVLRDFDAGALGACSVCWSILFSLMRGARRSWSVVFRFEPLVLFA
jgi:hypothetical protein